MTDSIKLPLTSADMTEALLAQLRAASPQIFSEGRVDFSKLQAALGEHIDTNPERYGLTWAGKRDAFRNVQVPSVATLRPQPEESVNWDSSENLIIEGDNLEVLKLLQKPYHGKVKMIYIDPPYNTGNEFIYPDNFREGLDEYLRYTGQLGEDGTATSTNKDTSGRYHSNWLNMMYPRLFLARNLLKEDGVIFVSIDDHEVHNLRLLMDEVFGEENFVANVIWEKRFTRSNNSRMFATLSEHILLYRKSEVLDELKEPRSEKADSIYSNPDNDPRGVWTSVSYVNPATKVQRPNLAYEIENPNNKNKVVHPTNAWKFERATHEKHVCEDRLYWGKSGEYQFPRLKKFLSEMEGGMVPVNLWAHQESGTTDEGSKSLEDLMSGKFFDFPKPIKLIARMLKLATRAKEQDIVLDFFAGSGTTAHAVLDLNHQDGGNRKFILVQLPEKTDNPQYPTIAHITRERVRRVIAKLQEVGRDSSRESELVGLKPDPPNRGDLGFRAFKLDSSNFKIWRSDQAPQSAEQLTEQLKLYADNVLAERNDQDRLYELILKSGRALSARVKSVTVGGHTAFSVGDGDLLICLEPHLDRDTLRALFARKPQMVLCLDVAFDGNDALKTNTVLEVKTHGIVFKTV